MKVLENIYSVESLCMSDSLGDQDLEEFIVLAVLEFRILASWYTDIIMKLVKGVVQLATRHIWAH